MHIVNASDFQNNFLSLLSSCDALTLIKGFGKKTYALMPVDSGMQETLYLMSSEANHKELMEAIEEFKNGQFEQHELVSV